MERLCPKAKLSGNLELFHSDFDVSGVNISFLDINVNGFLLFCLVTLIKGSLQSCPQALAETLEFLNSVVSIDKIKDFIEGGHIDIFQFLIDSDSLDDRFVSFPNQFELVSDLCLSLLDFRMEAIQNDFRRGFIYLNIRQCSYNGEISSGDLLIKDGFELLITVMLEYVLEGLRVLSLCDGSVGFEDILD